MKKIGLDIGSTITKLAHVENDGFVLSAFKSAEFYSTYGAIHNDELFINLQQLDFKSDTQVIATGYGREKAKIAGATEIPEIQAHAVGASRIFGVNTMTLIDFGGQDTKVIRVENAAAVDFLTSDRCAASTGRFLENMAAILGMTLCDLAACSGEFVTISNTCAVFAETELIDKISRGVPREKIAAGVNYSVVKRFLPLIARFPHDFIALTGGVALNGAIAAFLARELQCTVHTHAYSQYAGAIGCIFYDI